MPTIDCYISERLKIIIVPTCHTNTSHFVKLMMGFGDVMYAIPTKHQWDEYKTFAVERNPWAKVYAEFIYRRKSGDPEALVGSSVEDAFNLSFIHGTVRNDLYGEHLEKASGEMDFKDFDFFGFDGPFEHPDNPFKNERMPKDWHRYTKDGVVIVDNLFKYEDLFEEDYEYTDIYCEENKEIIGKYFEDEVKLLGYEY